ncbi:MAG TPA: hypothetical protein VFS20_00395 [Longimicrobium sp.]|nr:hypothetical protein [Longimicrobium sp.]
MPAVAHSIRVPEALENEIKREIARRGIREWSTGVLQLVDEAIRMSRAPGIVFVNAREGRRAALAFSGLEVWEIIAFWKERDENWEVFRSEFEELSEAQLRAALNYYALYPKEIDERLAKEAYWTPERVAAEFPFMQTRVEGNT